MHARGQVVSFDVADEVLDRLAARDRRGSGDGLRRLRDGLNALVGPAVVVTGAGVVDAGFDARFSARSRTYRYTVLNAEVRARMKTLNPTFREALWLFVVEGLSIREIADILGIPEATVKTRIHRAKAQLKEQLNPDTPGGTHVLV